MLVNLNENLGMSEDFDPMLYVHFDGLNPALTDVTMIVVAMNISKFTNNFPTWSY